MTVQYADVSTISGQTLTAKLFPYQSDTEVTGNTYSVTERTNDKGTYRVGITRSAVISGTYKITYFNGSTPVASGVRVFTGTDGEVAVTQSDAIKTKTDSIPTATAIADAVWDEARTGHATSGTFGFYLDAAISGISSGGGSGDASQSTLLGVQALVADAITRIEEESYTLDTVAEALAGGGGASVFEYLLQLSNAGTGAFTVTITITDGTSTLQNALVRIIDGATTYTAITDSSGIAVFHLDAATYVVAVSKAGYSYAGTTLVVDANETVSYAMTLNTLVIPPVGQIARRAIPVTVIDRVD